MVVYDSTAFATAEDAVRAAARAQGCTCTPDVTLGPYPHARVEHDDWCVLLRQGDLN